MNSAASSVKGEKEETKEGRKEKERRSRKQQEELKDS